MITGLERFFNRPLTKFFLAFLIILSVLPLAEVRRFDLAFFAVFSVELAVRIILHRRSREKRVLEAVMIAIDVVAVLSFLPLPNMIVEARYLRLIRLVRLSLLLRFVTSLARDMWGIVSRKEIKYQLGFLCGAVLILTFLSAIVLHALQVPVDLDRDGTIESGTLRDLLWWSFLQVESQDNIATGLSGPLLYIVFSIVLTVAGVFVMSLLIGLGASIVGDLLSAGRQKPVALSDHTVVIGQGRNLRYLLEVLTGIMKKNREKPQIALLSEAPDPPHFLYEPALRGIEYRSGDPSDPHSLHLVSAAGAGKVIITYDDEKKQLADAYSISTVLAVREVTSRPIHLELRNEENRRAALDAGGSSLVPIPMGKFMGSILCQNLIFPGIDRVFEDLLSASGSEIYTSFLSERDRKRLRESGREIKLRDLLHHGYWKHGIILLGVFLDDEGRGRLWLNPVGSFHAAAGAPQGMVSAARLAGLVGISRGKHHLDRLGEHLASGAGAEPAPAPEGGKLDFTLSESMTRLRNVLIVGENETLPTLVEETTRFVPRVEFTVLVPGLRRAMTLRQHLRGALECVLEGGGDTEKPWHCSRLTGKYDLTLLSSDEDVTAILMDAGLWKERCFDAVVFLSDTAAGDPDAQNLLWLFKLMDLAGGGSVALSPGFHILAEIAASEKGELVERRFAGAERRVVRAISTQKIRTYFMAQSCFVPSIWDVYSELLRSEGQDFCQAVLRRPEGRMTFSQMLAFLAGEGVTLLAVELKRGVAANPLILNPKPGRKEEPIDLNDIKHLYVVGDTEELLRARGSRVSIPPSGQPV